MVSKCGSRCLLDRFLIALWLAGILNVRHELVMIIFYEDDLKSLT